MAAKRLRGDDCDDEDQDQMKPKRMRSGRCFASVIRQVVMKNFFDNMCSTLEPLIRKVVSEEVESRLRSSGGLDWIPRYPSNHQIVKADANEEATKVSLRFTERLSLPIFTGTKIVDIHNNPLQIVVDNGGQYCSCNIRVEIVVLDGEFPGTNSDDFGRYIVKERTGKRPLIAGESKVITLWNGVGAVGDIEFTDNSSWIRSRRFRLGARVLKIQGGSPTTTTIREAVTEAFVVKDHRGELYKKHHPPALNDEVWRLEKIGKISGGAYIQRLVKDAYAKWNCLEEFDSQAHSTAQLLTHRGEMEGDSYNCSEQMSVMCYGGDAYLSNGSCEVDRMSNNEEGEWPLNSGFYISHGEL
ncbi:hypothetical protein F511_02877 [Dorcoceras hygrometricum]|uniref:Calmodulin binding protein-like N-terminal domain-containing protein n=1 Tax=Dorcoceras hygrometricum TaxID=472368 RepID=A0A2Z7AQT6_9LAMI|nr:hypothetical protein F511_02877 [Dorcoceras hygrometricum]